MGEYVGDREIGQATRGDYQCDKSQWIVIITQNPGDPGKAPRDCILFYVFCRAEVNEKTPRPRTKVPGTIALGRVSPSPCCVTGSWGPHSIVLTGLSLVQSQLPMVFELLVRFSGGDTGRRVVSCSQPQRSQSASFGFVCARLALVW